MENTTNDHDVLVRLDERQKQYQLWLDTNRQSDQQRLSKMETDFAAYRKEVEGLFHEFRIELESLRMSRAQILAIAATLSFLIGIGVKLFWK